MKETPSPNNTGRHVRRFWHSTLIFTGCFAVIWLLLFILESALPFVRPGSDVILEEKVKAVARGGLFSPDSELRVVVVGNSRTLAGFMPAVFDTLAGQGCQSYNLGLPGTNRYVAPLASMIAAGDIPTHVLIQAPWPTEKGHASSWQLLRRDVQVINAVFPFRRFPRNLAIFLAASHSRGGMRAYYRQKQSIASEVVARRGYYFIEGQSRYEGDRLPDNFALPSDTPETIYRRPFVFDSRAFDQLSAIAGEYRIELIIIPEYYRDRAFARPAGENEDTAEKVTKQPGWSLVGPDYFVYPNAYFSDAVHLNRDGAEIYTRQIAELIVPVLKRWEHRAPGEGGG